jgi:gliding motility-associated-like protein
VYFCSALFWPIWRLKSFCCFKSAFSFVKIRHKRYKMNERLRLPVFLLLLLLAHQAAAQSVSRSFAKGSLIIPMDNARQNLQPGMAFNVRAYGLVNALLQNNIPVHWAINDSKSRNGTDFTASASRTYPTAIGTASVPFAGGPFVVDSLWAAKAIPVISSYGQNVAVYTSTASFNAPIRYELMFRPKIAVFTNGGNQLVHTKALRLAGFTSPAHFDSLPGQNLNSGGGCYTLATDPHWTGNTSSVINAVNSFVGGGGNFFTQCSGIDSYEDELHWHTTNGIEYETTDSHKDNANLYYLPANPLMQFDGDITNVPTGTIVNYQRNSGSYQSGTTFLLRKNPIPTSGIADGDIVCSSRKVSSTASGGQVTYLGGHDYLKSAADGNEFARISDVNWNNGLRIFLNAIFMPPTRPAACNISFAGELAVSSSISTGQPCANTNFNYTVAVANSGPGTARNVQVKVQLPTGVNYVSFTASQGTFNNATRIWTIGNISPGVTVTLSLTLTAGSGVYVLKSWNADLVAGNLFPNDTTQLGFQTDPTPPTITAPAAVSTITNSGCTATGVNLGTPVTADNCGVASVTNNAPSAFPLGTTTVTWTVTDNSGNTATATQNVTVTDETDPVITAPANLNRATNTGCTATGVSLGTPTTSDNCGVASVTNNAPSSYPLGTTTVTWTVTDNAGNTSTAVQTVTVTDNVNPTITAPSNINTTTNSGCTRTGMSPGTPVTADNCGVATVTNNAPAAFPLGSTIVTWTVTDNSGNTATATQTVTVTDNVNPTITAPSNINTTTNSGCTRTGLSLGSPVTADNCGVATVTNNAPAAFPLGSTIVTWTVTDNSGNTATATQTVNVTDNVNPTITAPSNINTTTNSGCTRTGLSLGSPVTADNCGVATVTNNAPTAFLLGTTTVTWTVTDNSGNTATAAQTVTVTDNVNPTITAPSNINTTTNSGCTRTGLNLGTPVTADNCGVATVTNNAPTAFLLGTTTVTWTVTDNSGNTATAAQTVTVTDNVNPTITAPANIATTTNSGCTRTGLSLGTPVTADNCGVANVTNNAPSVFLLGATTVTWTVTDNSGNTATATQIITVTDNVNPTITAPSNINTTTNSGCTRTGLSLGTPVTADNCGVASVINNAPSAFPLGATIVAWTVTDNSGNTATATQTVTVTDDDAPAITAPANVSATTNSGCTATGVDLGSPVTSDNCGVATVTNNAPSAFPLGTTTVTWTVNDNSGNATTATQTVTVTDNVNPVITAPADISANTNTGCTATGVSLGSPVTSDNCGVASVANDAPSAFPLGVTIVTWTVTDNAGNTATATQTVTVTDNVNPMIAAPADIAATTNSACTAIGVALGTPTTSDNCGVAGVSNNAPTSFSLGITIVTWTVTDNSGNTATAPQTVTVTDDDAPAITAPADINTVTNSGCTATGVSLGTPETSDNCGVASITNNAPTAFSLGTTTVTWTVTDNSGNSSTATQTVTVTDDTDPSITAPANVSVVTNSGCTVTGLNLGAPETADNCGVASVSNDAPAAFPTGSTVVTWTVTDNAGNSSTATQTVTVADTEDPVITAPSDLNVTTNSGCTAAGVNSGVPSVSDNCSVASVTNDAPSAFPLGTTTVTWTVTDNSGNTATAIQTVTVTDDDDPVITAPANMSAAANSGCTATGLSLGTPVNSDNCGVATVTNDAPSVFPLGITTVTWTVTDNSGNSATAIQTVTITDDADPVITAPANITIAADGDCAVTGLDPGTPVTSDNCGVASVSNNAPSSYPVGQTIITWTVTDNSGNTAVATQTITVTDDEPPLITAPADISASMNDGCVATGISLGLPETSDNCGVASVTNDAPAQYPAGTTTVTWTVTDNGGNTSTATQLVTVTDDTSPMFAISGDTIYSCTPNVVFDLPVASDNCTLASIVQTDATGLGSGSDFPAGITALEFTATDIHGNTGLCQKYIRVTSPPQTAQAGEDQLVYLTHTELSAALGPNEDGEWNILSGSGSFDDENSVSATVSGLSRGENLLLWTVSELGCSGAADTVRIFLADLVIPNGFSPDGNGSNDVFAIEGIDSFSPAELTVLNSWGAEVYHSADYSNDWNGESRSGSPLPEDTYYYSLKLNDGTVVNGFIMLKRK